MLIIGYLTEKEYCIYSAAKFSRNTESTGRKKNNFTT
jgi:hypothetical protein